MLNYILGSDSVTVFLDGKSYTINKQAKTYDAVLSAVKESNVEKLRSAVNIRKSIGDQLTKANSNVRIEGNKIYFGEHEVSGLIGNRVFEMIRLGLDTTPMVKFIGNLMKNPSMRAVNELFGFMEVCKLPVTPDGHFLAYKRVRADYKDVYSGTMDNSVGQVLEMPRFKVDEDKDRTCSQGLHFCSYDYLQHFSGERIVVVKINPADVVAIPSDYNNNKGRTCRYEVVDEIALNEYRMPETQLDEYATSNSYEDDDWFEVTDAVDDVVQVFATKNSSAKLTPDDVRSIRIDLKDGVTLSAIAKIYGVSPRSIARIRDGQAWADVV